MGKRRSPGREITRGAVGIATVIAVWYFGAAAISKPILPYPHEALTALCMGFFPEIARHFAASLLRVLAAMMISLAVGLPLGIAVGQIRSVGQILDPVLSVLHPIPKIVFLPVLYLLAGINDVSKIVLISSVLVLQIIIFVRDAVRNVSEDIVTATRALNAGRLALFRFIYLPAAIPATFTSLRVSTGTAVAILFISEQSVTAWGLGYYIMVKTYQVLRYTEMYAGILAISILGAGLYFALHLIEKKLTLWKKQ